MSFVIYIQKFMVIFGLGDTVTIYLGSLSVWLLYLQPGAEQSELFLRRRKERIRRGKRRRGKSAREIFSNKATTKPIIIIYLFLLKHLKFR